MTLDSVADTEQAIFATGGYDHTIKIWQTHSGICQRTVQHADSVSTLLFSQPNHLQYYFSASKRLGNHPGSTTPRRSWLSTYSHV